MGKSPPVKSNPPPATRRNNFTIKRFIHNNLNIELAIGPELGFGVVSKETEKQQILLNIKKKIHLYSMDLSIVDLSPLIPGQTRHDALHNSIEVAQHIEKLGYKRIWFAEHHSTAWVVGRAPEVMMAAAAAHTSSIRVGSGSVLLNQYSPLKVAEEFSTLHELYPNRVDVGIGRANTDPVTDLALQQDRSKRFQANSDEQIQELVTWFNDDFPRDHPFSQITLHTLETPPPLYLLGSSPWSASAASQLGLPYVFAGFINQTGTPDILSDYHNNFEPSNSPIGIESPKAILSVHVVCADTEEEALRQLAPITLMYRYLSKGITDAKLPTPDNAIEELGGLPKRQPYEKGSGIPPRFIGGTPEQVHEELSQLSEDLSIDEIIIQDLMTDHSARLHSYELIASVFKKI